MHLVVAERMGLDTSNGIRHKNHNGLTNTRSNLRVGREAGKRPYAAYARKTKHNKAMRTWLPGTSESK